MKGGKASQKPLMVKGDREAFEELMDMCMNNAMASGNAYNPSSVALSPQFPPF